MLVVKLTDKPRRCKLGTIETGDGSEAVIVMVMCWCSNKRGGTAVVMSPYSIKRTLPYLSFLIFAIGFHGGLTLWVFTMMGGFVMVKLACHAVHS